jgi:hypothetical protein
LLSLVLPNGKAQRQPLAHRVERKTDRSICRPAMARRNRSRAESRIRLLVLS